MFEVVPGTKNKKEELKNKKLNLYKKNYYENLYFFKENASNDKAAFYGVKYLSRFNIKKHMEDISEKIIDSFLNEKLHKKIKKTEFNTCLKLLDKGLVEQLDEILYTGLSKELAKYNCDFLDTRILMADLTFNQFIKLFPIIKTYDGQRFESKDYFSVMEYLNQFNLDEKIGVDRIDELCWNYYNNDICFFIVNSITCLDKIAQINNQPTFFDRFLNEVDKENKIHTYTFNKEEGYMQDNKTGETFKISKNKNKNKNIRLVKD